MKHVDATTSYDDQARHLEVMKHHHGKGQPEDQGNDATIRLDEPVDHDYLRETRNVRVHRSELPTFFGPWGRAYLARLTLSGSPATTPKIWSCFTVSSGRVK
jgi:hypothetical protein